jgi:1,4-alpha-glucan branching enzyme
MVTQRPDGTVQFEFFRPDAGHVSLAGEFNSWRTDGQRMKRGTDGWWRCDLRLMPGFYQFRYIADGQWYTDYAAFGVEPTPLGLNSVLKVDPPVVAEIKVEPVADDDARQAA